MDYFTKWINEEAIAHIMGAKVQKFIWKTSSPDSVSPEQWCLTMVSNLT